MKLLRFLLIIYAAICIFGVNKILQEQRGNARLILAGYLLVNSTIIILGVLFERRRYKPKVSNKSDWQPNGERFIDQTTGKLMEVHSHPKTGERDYRQVTSKTKL